MRVSCVVSYTGNTASPLKSTNLLILYYRPMNIRNWLWKIFVDEARGFLLDVFGPVIRLTRWMRRRDRK